MSDAVVVFEVSGQIGVQHVAELQRLLATEPEGRRLVLDLANLCLIDREAVGVLADWKARGVQLENCPAYIRAWVERHDRKGST